MVRRLALEMPYPFIEGCYKGLYLTFVRHSKFTNSNVSAGQANLFKSQLYSAYSVILEMCWVSDF